MKGTPLNLKKSHYAPFKKKEKKGLFKKKPTNTGTTRSTPTATPLVVIRDVGSKFGLLWVGVRGSFLH